MKDKKIIAFLRNSLIVVVFVCILIFSVMTALMACWTQQAVRDISDIYMKDHMRIHLVIFFIKKHHFVQIIHWKSCYQCNAPASISQNI